MADELISREALIATFEKIAKEDKNNYFHLDEITQEIFDAPVVNAVVLPCKVRDRIWLTEWWSKRGGWEKLSSPIERHVIYFSIECDGIYAHLKEGCLNVKHFGVVAFLTREEAEKALEGRENNES